ncbi:MAG: MFS transporter [Chloroflexi bacterium]|nr:MFS transporter [Chloroflexota bacterium]MBI3340336.1 MFS transporter [Chloroflexota bacterium]
MASSQTTAPADKLDFKRILPVVVIILVDLIGLSIIIPLLPLYAARFGAAPFTIGILQAAYPLMQFAGAPILGRLSDRFGRKPILLVSQIGTLAGFILLGFSNTLWLLFLSRIIDGLSGANLSTAQAAIADSTTEKTRTQGLGLIGAAFGIGFVLGPIVAFIVLAASGQNYQMVAFTAAIFSLASILLTSIWFRETKSADALSASARKPPFNFHAMIEALSRPAIGFLLILMFFYQIAFGGYEQLFSLFTLTRLGMDARDTSGLFVLAGLFIIVVQGGLIGRWSKQKGDRWLVILGISSLAVGLIFTALTPAIPVPWFDKARVLASLAGEGVIRVSVQNIHINLPDQSTRGWAGIIWLLAASFPAALGGGVLHPAINSLITKSANKSEVGGMLGVSTAFYSAANAIAPLFYGSLFQWLGAPVPFMAGGLILAVLWMLSRRAIPKPANV